MQLMHELYEDITLEKQLLGDRAHRVIRDIDLQMPSLKEKHKHKLVHDLTAKVRKLWEPLKEIQVRCCTNTRHPHSDGQCRNSVISA